MPPHKNQVNFDSQTTTKYFSTATQKQSQFRSIHWSQVKFDPHHQINSTMMPWHQNQVNFDPYTKAKSFSTPTLKTKSIPISTLKSS